MPLDDWMGNLRTTVQAVTGIRKAYKYDEIPANFGTVLPAALIVPVSGEVEYSIGGPNISIHNIQVVVYVTAQVLSNALADAVPFIELVRNAIAADVTLGGTVVHILPGSPFYEGPMGINYGDRQLIGIVFNYMVKENETGSYPVTA